MTPSDTTDTTYRPGEVLNDEAQNVTVVCVGTRDDTAGDIRDVWDNSRNQHYDPDPDEPVYQCVYMPDDGEVKVPGRPYDIPESRLTRVKVEDAIDMGDHPLDVLQARDQKSVV